jgi:PAS domain S-box-containing protein
MDSDRSRDPPEYQPMEELRRWSSQELADFLAHAAVGLHWVGPGGAILWANQAELDLLGCPREEYIGHHIAEFHADPDVPVDILQRLARHETLHNYEARLRCKDGSIKHVLIDSNMLWENGRVIHTRCITRDITAYRRAEQRIAIEHAIARVLAESSTLKEAAPRLLQAIGESLGWEVGAFWCVDPRDKVLRCRDLWQAPSVAVVAFAARTREGTFAPGVGLPGRVWASGTPAWVADVTEDDHFPRASVAARDGLHAAFGFPLPWGREILGVVEFFSRMVRPPDDALVQMMATIGSQIGQFMARKRVEEALEQSRRRLQGLFDHALDAILFADDEARYADANPAACALTGYSREELLGLSVWDLTPGPERDHGRELWRTFLADGHQHGEYSLACKDGRHLEVEYRAVAHIVPGLHLSVLHDITARKQSEARQRFLAEASAILAGSLDYETTLATVARLAVRFLADWCLIDMLEEGGSIRRLAAAHADPAKEAFLHDLQRRYPLDPEQLHAILGVLHTGRPELYPELSEKRLAAATRDAEHLRRLQELGVQSTMIVPLRASGQTLGAITLIMAESGRRYTPADLAFAEDLTHRCALAVDNARLYRQAQGARYAQEETLALLNTILASAPVGLGFLDGGLRYVRLNPALAAINGMPLEAHLGRTPDEMNPQLTTVLDPLWRYTLETGKPVVNAEVTGETHAAPGQTRHWLVSYYPVRTSAKQLIGIGMVVVDITERKQVERQVQGSLREKEVLLREIHHRVRNNMQVISSLLSLQAGYSQDPAIQALIADSQHRIQAMALIHESLYQSRDLGHINFAHYLRSLADNLWRTYDVDDTRIRLHLDIEEVYLDIDHATPCGLLLNELVSNCLKHAFPPGRNGAVHIGLHTAPEHQVGLVVRDTGIGFPEALDFRQTNTLGLQLVTALADQLQGTIALDRQGGTTFTITFPA